MLTSRDKILHWLEKMKIEHYTINKNGVVDVDSRVDISYCNLTSIPIQFGVVNGGFNCSNNKLKSLKGSPSHITMSFNCSENPLKNLSYFPKQVGQYVHLGNIDMKMLLSLDIVNTSKTILISHPENQAIIEPIKDFMVNYPNGNPQNNVDYGFTKEEYENIIKPLLEKNYLFTKIHKNISSANKKGKIKV